MSEIFDFLKKTEVDSRKKFPSAPPTVDLPLSEEETARPAVEQEFDSVPAVSEIVPSDKFDLAECSPQLRNALDPATVVGEQFRALRTRLNLLQKQNEISILDQHRPGRKISPPAPAALLRRSRGSGLLLLIWICGSPGPDGISAFPATTLLSERLRY